MKTTMSTSIHCCYIASKAQIEQSELYYRCGRSVHTHRVMPHDQISTLYPEKVSSPAAISGDCDMGVAWLVDIVSSLANRLNSCAKTQNMSRKPFLEYYSMSTSVCLIAGNFFNPKNMITAKNVWTLELSATTWQGRNAYSTGGICLIKIFHKTELFYGLTVTRLQTQITSDTPKSVIFKTWSIVSNKLAGLISLCIIPREWRYSMPSMSCVK
mgnify:CR=1 FL=1